MKKLSFLYILIFISLLCPLFSQSPQKEKLKIGQSYENSGDYKNASRIYLELYNENSSQEHYEPLMRVYKQMNRFSELLPIVEERAKKQNSNQVSALLGELYWRIGKTDDANTIWGETLEKFGKIPETYLILCQAQINVKQFDKAIITLTTAREKFGQKHLFADELSQLYIAVGNYKNGIEEVINILNNNGRLSEAQGRISALIISKEAKEHIGEYFKNLTDNSNNYNYYWLYSWFLKLDKNYDKALEVIVAADSKFNRKSQDIFEFAMAAAKDKDYEVALKAYKIIIDGSPSNPYFMRANFDYVNTLEMKLRSKDSITVQDADIVIEEYRSLLKKSFYSQLADECNYRIALIYFDIMNDLEKSLQQLESLKSNASSPIAVNSKLLTAEIYFVQNKIDDSKAIYKKIINDYGKVFPEESDLAKLRLVEMEYYFGEIDSAMNHFGELSLKTQSDIGNDALEKMIFIEQNKKYVHALQLFAKAELNEKQRKYDDAIKLFEQAAEAGAGTDIAEQSYSRKINILFKQKKQTQAQTEILSFLEKFPNSINSDLMLLTLADSYYNERKNDLALKYYQDLLMKYPRSIYLVQARAKIRLLRNPNKI